MPFDAATPIERTSQSMEKLKFVTMKTSNQISDVLASSLRDSSDDRESEDSVSELPAAPKRGSIIGGGRIQISRLNNI